MPSFSGAHSEGPTIASPVLNINAAGTVNVKAFEQVIIGNLPAAAAVTVNMPSPAEAAGKIYTVRARTVGAGAAMTVVIEGLTSLTLDATNDRACLYSDGYQWFTLDSVIA